MSRGDTLCVCWVRPRRVVCGCGRARPCMRMWATAWRKVARGTQGGGVARGGAGGAPVIKVLRGARQLRAARAARQHGAGRLAVLRRQVLRLGRMDGWVDRRIDGWASRATRLARYTVPIYPSIYPSMLARCTVPRSLSIVSIHLSIHPSIFLSIHPSIHLSMCVYPSIYLSYSPWPAARAAATRPATPGAQPPTP